MFWWLYRSPYRVENPTKPWPIILWLQGGPVSIIWIKPWFEFWTRTIHVFMCLWKWSFKLLNWTGWFRSWIRKFCRVWPSWCQFGAKEFHLVEKSRFAICGNSNFFFLSELWWLNFAVDKNLQWYLPLLTVNFSKFTVNSNMHQLISIFFSSYFGSFLWGWGSNHSY